MTDEYIKRGELISDLNKFAPEAYSRAVDLVISNQTAADVVEVVRCKDCKSSNHCGEVVRCSHPYGLTICDGNDFCSYGERGDNNAAD